MPHQILEIDLTPISSDFEVQGGASRKLSSLSKINLFVGPNNTGKSRFLRELSKLSSPTFLPLGLKSIRELRDHFAARLGDLIGGPFTDINGYKKAAGALPLYQYVTAGQDSFGKFVQLAAAVAQTEASNLRSELIGINLGQHAGHLALPLSRLGTEIQTKLDELLKSVPTSWEFERIYIPTLRGLRPFDGNGDFYLQRTLKDYFKDSKGLVIPTGLELNQSIRSLLLGTLSDRRVVESFQKFLGNTFFEGLPVALIPREKSDVLFIKIGDEEEQPVFNLGDGIQMIVAIMFPVFRAQSANVLLFIEEPELYLHPGMQRTLINALCSFDNVQCFVATHSNHLLDLTIDRPEVAIFSVKKELVGENSAEKKAKSVIEVLSSSDTRVLNLLGVRSSSVFLANCTIWVEGITDRRYLRRFLQLYMRKKHNLSANELNELPFKEDLHFSFVEYGGSNITHWSFLDSIEDPILVDRLCARLMLIADRDSSKTKGNRHSQLAEKLGDRFWLLPRREIENLLMPETLKAVLNEYGETEESFKDFNYDAYADQMLGEFIETNVLRTKQRRGRYSEDSGTMTDKVLFCDRALAQLCGVEQLSPDAEGLAKRVYEFIVSQNPK